MRSYEQHCALASALDVVGDRWTLLIVRELLIRQPCRYTDLQYGLPGIATNLLADRLRQLEAVDVVTREAAAPPIATTVFRLTARGEELRPVLSALGRWGAPLLETVPPGAAFRSHWLAFPLGESLCDNTPDEARATIAVRVGGDPLTIEVGGGDVVVRTEDADAPDTIVSGPPLATLRLLVGRSDLAEAREAGVEVTGDLGTLRRVRPTRSP